MKRTHSYVYDCNSVCTCVHVCVIVKVYTHIHSPKQYSVASSKLPLRPTKEAKETYYRGKRDLRYRQKRPTIEAHTAVLSGLLKAPGRERLIKFGYNVIVSQASKRPASENVAHGARRLFVIIFFFVNVSQASKRPASENVAHGARRLFIIIFVLSILICFLSFHGARRQFIIIFSFIYFYLFSFIPRCA